MRAVDSGEDWSAFAFATFATTAPSCATAFADALGKMDSTDPTDNKEASAFNVAVLFTVVSAVWS